MVVYTGEVMYGVFAYLPNITFNLQDEDILVVTQRFNNFMIYCVLTPLSAIFQLYHGDRF